MTLVKNFFAMYAQQSKDSWQIFLFDKRIKGLKKEKKTESKLNFNALLDPLSDLCNITAIVGKNEEIDK